MSSGRVKWFDENKGYGYILAQDGREIFVHFSAIEMQGFKTLPVGAMVVFDFVEGEKGPLATRVLERKR